MVCVLNAAQEAGVPFEAILFKEIKRERHLFGLDRSNLIVDPGRPDFSDDTKSLLARVEGPVFSFIGGMKHIEFALRQQRHPSEPPFDFVLAEKPHLPLEDDAEIIPYDAIEDALRRSYGAHLKMLRRIAQLTRAPVYQFESPPPVADSWMAARAKGKGPIETNGSLELRGRFVRYKLWRLTSQLFREQAETVGARFVEHPPAAVDEEGFMRDELVRNMSHGNERYGVLVFEQLRSLE